MWIGFLLVALAVLAPAQAQVRPCFWNNTFLSTFYAGPNLEGAPTAQRFGIVYQNWGNNASYPGGPTNIWSANFEGFLVPQVDGTHKFWVESDDGFRMYVNGVLHCAEWILRSMSYTLCPDLVLTRGRPIQLKFDYQNRGGQQGFVFRWRPPGGSGNPPVPTQFVYYTNCTGYRIVGNSSLSLDTSIGSINGQYALTELPNGTVTVTVKSDCYLQSVCVLVFNQTTWSIPQSVTFFPDPNSDSLCCNAILTASSNDAYNRVNFTTRICKVPSIPAKGMSWGDPHYDTFDGKVYTYWGQGDYWVLREVNGDFVIQTRQVACAQASCNGLLAIKYRSVTLFLSVDARTGIPSSNIVGSSSANSVTITSSANTFTFTTPRGAVAKVVVGYWDTRRLYFLDVTVTLTNYYRGRVYGLMGFYDGNIANDYTMSNGTVITSDNLIHVFQESWRVRPSEDLFLNSSIVDIPAIFGGGSGGSTVNPVPCGNNPVPTGRLNDTNSTERPTFPPPPFDNRTTNCLSFSNATLQAEAIEACKVINNTCCNNLGVNSTSYYNTCLCDYNGAGGNDFVASNVAAFTSACNTEAARANTTCIACPNGCSGHGNCLSNGTCNCTTGWKGADCSTPTDLCTEVFTITPSSGGRMCTNTITITGNNFVASTLYCMFGNITVPAIKISNYQVTCQVPKNLGNSATVYVFQNGTCKSSSSVYTLSIFCCDGPTKTTTSWGDPHIDSIDGVFYTFLDLGDFYFIRQTSGELVVQQRQTVCGGGGCNSAIAVKYLGFVFYASLPNFQVNSILVQSNVHPSLFGVTITTNGPRTRYYITLPTGAKINILTNYWANINLYYLNVQAILPASYQRTIYGLAGTFDNNRTNDFTYANGFIGPLSNPNAFARTWNVPNSQNLFLSSSAVIGPIFGGSTPSNIPPSPCQNNTTPTAPIPTAPNNPFNRTQNSTNNFDCYNFTNATLFEMAQEACDYFNNSCCNDLGINGTAYYRTCLCDFNLGQGDGLLSSSVDAYSQLCDTLAAQAGVTCNTPTLPPTTPPPTTIPPSCVNITSVGPMTGGLYCGTEVTITGSMFLGSNMLCNFGGHIVRATIIDDNTATCKVPAILLNDVTVTIVSFGSCSSDAGNFTLTNMCCIAATRTTSTWGDPHINTIDGSFFTTYSPPGNYYFLRQTNGDFVVQTTQFPCYTAYCNSAVAIRYLNVNIYVNFTIVSGVTTLYTVGDLNAAGITVENNNPRFVFRFPTGIRILTQVVAWPAENVHYLVVTASIPLHYRTYIYGWGGYFDSNPANDFTALDGTVYPQGSNNQQLIPFANTWRVPAGEDLWLNPSAVIGPIFGGGPRSPTYPQSCFVPTTPPPPAAFCPDLTDDDGIWGRGTLDTTVYGRCPVGGVGTPTRRCLSNGTYGPAMTVCVPAANACSAQRYLNAEWPGTLVEQTATGTCVPGFSGTPTRKCNIDSRWSTFVESNCQPIRCLSRTENGASWPSTNAGSSVFGTCSGSGRIFRNCSLDGNWGPISGGCASVSPNCPPSNITVNLFGSTAPDTIATGTCATNFQGAPQRYCGSNGVWSTNILSGHCQRITCAPVVINNVSFGMGTAGLATRGNCLVGTGSPARLCLTSGLYGPQSGRCFP